MKRRASQETEDAFRENEVVSMLRKNPLCSDCRRPFFQDDPLEEVAYDADIYLTWWREGSYSGFYADVTWDCPHCGGTQRWETSGDNI